MNRKSTCSPFRVSATRALNAGSCELPLSRVTRQLDPGGGRRVNSGAWWLMSLRSQVITRSPAMYDQISEVPPLAVPISRMMRGLIACTACARRVISDGICSVLIRM